MGGVMESAGEVRTGIIVREMCQDCEDRVFWRTYQSVRECGDDKVEGSVPSSVGGEGGGM